MLICSGIAGNECKQISVPDVRYDEYHECIIYGYDYSSTLLKSMNPLTVNEFEIYTKFDCWEETTI
tara:strand:+ start:514 stop:711 length:198 start_codon:yes stop_codon:yes gene_type:complete